MASVVLSQTFSGRTRYHLPREHPGTCPLIKFASGACNDVDHQVHEIHWNFVKMLPLTWQIWGKD